MRTRTFLCIAFALTVSHSISAQPIQLKPPTIDPPPLFRGLDAEKLREAIVIPVSALKLGVRSGRSGSNEPELPVAVLEKKLVGDDRDAETLLKLGHALTKAKSDRAKAVYVKAAEAFHRRTKVDPKNVKLHLGLAHTLYELERFEDAINWARRSVELDPKNAETWNTLEYSYWRDFFTVLYGNADSFSVQFGTDRAPPMLERELTAVERERAKSILAQIRTCQTERQRQCRADIDNLMRSALMGSHLEFFDAFLRTQKWDLHLSDSFKTMVSQKMIQACVERGRETQEPGMYGIAAMSQFMAFMRESPDSDWSYAVATPAQKKVLASIIAPIEPMTKQKDAKAAGKAYVVLAMLAFMEQDIDKMQKHVTSARDLAPRDNAVLGLTYLVQSDMAYEQRRQFWMEHARKHPSARAWEFLAAIAFREGKLEEAEQFILQGETIDPKVGMLRLMKASVMLKRGKAPLPEVAKLLDALERQADEPADRDEFVEIEQSPPLRDSCKYLRAIHKALAGNWEQARNDLDALRDADILTKEIGQALEAFPIRPILLAPVTPVELKK